MTVSCDKLHCTNVQRFERSDVLFQLNARNSEDKIGSVPGFQPSLRRKIVLIAYLEPLTLAGISLREENRNWKKSAEYWTEASIGLIYCVRHQLSYTRHLQSQMPVVDSLTFWKRRRTTASENGYSRKLRLMGSTRTCSRWLWNTPDWGCLSSRGDEDTSRVKSTNKLRSIGSHSWWCWSGATRSIRHWS